MEPKQVEIFCGTGGVGKTTVSCARALNIAGLGKKALLITIDPAKRLRQVLDLKESKDGQIETVSGEIFGEEYKEVAFDAMILSPRESLLRVAKSLELESHFQNNIVETLTKPYGGMNEIMAIVEVQYQLSLGIYDSIILDTPPGKHFVDFLNSTNKINSFFDKNFVEIFKYLGKKTKGIKQPKLLSIIVKTGVKKLLGYLEKVTGGEFLHEFIETVTGIYQGKEVFTRALSFEKDIQDPKFGRWYLVTSVEQQKLEEAAALSDQVGKLLQHNNYLIVNKCLAPFLQEWETEEGSALQKIKDTMLVRENKLKQEAKNMFKDVLEIGEVIGSSPTLHVQKIAQNWESF